MSAWWASVEVISQPLTGAYRLEHNRPGPHLKTKTSYIKTEPDGFHWHEILIQMPEGHARVQCAGKLPTVWSVPTNTPSLPLKHLHTQTHTLVPEKAWSMTESSIHRMDPNEPLHSHCGGFNPPLDIFLHLNVSLKPCCWGMLLNYSEVTRLGVNEHPMSRTGLNVHLIAAGHHVQGVPLPFPWRVISVLPCSLFLLNVNGAQAKADARAWEKALQDVQSILPSLRVPPPPICSA